MRKGRFGCAACSKGVQYGNKVSHAKNRTRIFRRPNLHSHKMVIDGIKTKVMLCTKCKRLARKAGGESEQQKPAKK